MVPAPSISAVGKEPERMLPASVWWLIEVTEMVLFQLAPPFVEVKASSAVSLAFSIGTTTVPLGCTRGCPPITVALLAVDCLGLHVNPPSEEVLIWTRLPLPLSSHSV